MKTANLTPHQKSVRALLDMLNMNSTNDDASEARQPMFKVTMSKKTAAGWDRDWCSGQLEHMASYHASEKDANRIAEKKDAELLESICDGLGLDYGDEADRDKANERREQFYHVIEIEA